MPASARSLAPVSSAGVVGAPQAVWPGGEARAEPALPQPWQLAALGTVLCLYRARGAELDGWRRAARVEVCSALHADALYESLQFHDRDGQGCWRLFLLPDTDFLAWEALARTLPVAQAAGGGIAERLWRRLAHGVSGAAWRCSVLRLSLSPEDEGGAGRLTASLATLSALGAEVAQRIVQSEGVEGAARIDECCCERSARLAAAGARPATHWTPLKFDKT
ncbi:Hemin transport protein [Luteimonas sp. Y-2-2-4F]|nr:Hemin transport protein [Luteimonas sp. Y-2-2-4F]MCD9032676.1 Hemin transport protein [Luteimonas sp. Y-2-2-4F]